MKVLALVAVPIEVPGQPASADEHGVYDDIALLDKVKSLLDQLCPGHCGWCEEAESEKYLAHEGHDDECPFKDEPDYKLPGWRVQWAVPMIAPFVRNTADGKELACGRCGSTELRYEESSLDIRACVDNDARHEPALLRFSQDTDRSYDDGDNLPGVVCTNCNAGVDVGDDVEIDFEP